MTKNAHGSTQTLASDRYTSLQEINQEHSRLMTLGGKNKSSLTDDDFWNDVEQFVERACAAGAVIYSESDRDAAQKLLTYWANALYRAGRDPKETLLDDFDEAACPDLSDQQCPYRGIGSGSAGPSSLAGWQRLIRECLEKLSSNRLLGVVGGEGSGRGFLVFEGVVPAVRAGGIPASDQWRILPEYTPTSDPLTELVRLIVPTATGSEIASQVTRLRQDPTHLDRMLNEQSPSPTLLIVNQFDRFFISVKIDDTRVFIRNLLQLIKESKHRVILKLRTESLAHVAAEEELGPLFEQGRVLVALTSRELRQMIEEPARQIGLRFDEGLVDRIVLDIQGDPLAACLLQFTLSQLWDYRDGSRITFEKYKLLGGGRLAIERAAERLYQNQLKRGDQEIAKKVWMALEQPGIGHETISRHVRKSELCRHGESPDDVSRVLTQLVESRLIRRIPGTNSAEDEFAVSQEAVVQVWPRLIEWLEEARDERRRWMRLRAAAEQWREQGDDTKLLWGGIALKEAALDPRVHDPDAAIVRQFIEAGREFENRERKQQIYNWSAAIVLVVTVATLIIIGLIREHAFKEYKDKQKLDKIIADDLNTQHDNELARDARMKSDMRLSLTSARFGLEKAGLQGSEQDPTGALVWFSEAIDLFRNGADSLSSPEEQENLLTNFSCRLAIASRSKPVVAQVLPQPDMGPADVSLDGRWAVTASSAKGQTTARLWDLTSGKSRDLPHGGVVNDACFTADSQFLFTGSTNDKGSGSVRLWDLQQLASRGALAPLTPADERSFVEDATTTSLLAVSAKGNRILAVSNKEDRENADHIDADAKTATVFIWDPRPNDKSSPSQRFLESIKGTVKSAAFTPDGKDVVICYNDPQDRGHLIVWDGKTEKPGTDLLANFDISSLNHACIVHSNDVNDSKDWVVACFGKEGSQSGGAGLINIKGGNPFWMPHNRPVVHVTPSPDGSSVATSCSDGTARVWKIGAPNAELDKSLRHGSDLRWSAFSPDGLFLATGGRDRKARIWDLSTGTLAQAPLEVGGTVSRVKFCGDGFGLFAQGGDRAVLWDLRTHTLPAITLNTAKNVRFASLQPKSERIVTIAESDEMPGHNEVRVWNAKSGEPVSPALMLESKDSPPPEASPGRPVSAVLSADGRRVVAVSSSNTVMTWDLTSSVPNLRQLSHDLPIHFVCLSPDGTKLVALGNDWNKQKGVAFLWRLDQAATDAPPKRFEVHHAPLNFATFNHDGQQVVTCGGNPYTFQPTGEAFVWRADSGHECELVRKFEKHKEPVTYAVFSSDNRYVATASVDDTSWIWAAHTGLSTSGDAADTLLKRHTADVAFVAFNPVRPDQLITAGKDGDAILWDWQAKHEVIVMSHEGNPLTSVAFSRDGHYLVTTGQGTTARIWDLQTRTSNDTAIKAPALIGDLPHPNTLIAADYVPGIDNTIRSLSYLIPEKKIIPTRPTAPGMARLNTEPELSRSVQLRQWNLAPMMDDALASAQSNAIRLAARTVAKESQTLVAVPVSDLANLKPSQSESVEASATDLLRHRRIADESEVLDRWYSVSWHLTKLIDGGDQSPQLYLRRARSFAKLNMWDKARDDYGIAIMADATRSQAYAGRAAAYSHLPEGSDSALADYAQAIDLNPTDPNLWAEKAAVFDNQSMLADAVEAYTKALELVRPTGSLRYSDILLRRATIQQKLQHSREAAADYELAGDGYAKSYQPQALIAATVAYTNAVTALKKLEPRDLPAEGRVYARRGWLHLRERGPSSGAAKDTALGDFNEALKSDYKDWSVYQGLGTVYFRTGKWADAAVAYQEAVKLAPQNLAPVNELINAVSNSNDLSVAAATYTEALKSLPQNIPLLHARAEVYSASKQWKLALADYDRLIESDGKNLPYYEQRAAVYAADGNLDAATSDLTRVLQSAAPTLNQSSVLYRLATLRLKAGDTAGYQRYCQKLESDFGQKATGNLANLIVWTLVLSKDCGVPPSRVLELAERTLQSLLWEESYGNTLRTAYYRAGKYKQVLESWARSNNENTLPTVPGILEDWLVLAMTYQKLNKPDLAKQWYQKSAQFMKQDAETSGGESKDLDIWQQFDRQAIARDADELINGKSASPP